MTLRNPHEQTEAFQPLGAPIRPGASKPAASPAVVSPGIIRHADGTLGTAIPPPSAPAPVVRAMRERDLKSVVITAIAWEGTEPPIPASAWPAYSKDYEAGYRDGYAAAHKDAACRKPILLQESFESLEAFRKDWEAVCAAPYHQQQAADWLTITKQVQDMPSK